MRLKSLYFDTEYHFDYLTLTDCQDERVIASISGQFSQNVVYFSTSNCMQARFKSDASLTKTGFKVYFDSVDKSFVEGETPQTIPTASTTGEIKLDSYGPNTDQIWNFKSEKDNVTLRVDVTSLITEAIYDYVFVYDGDNVTSPVLVQLSGDVADPQLSLPPFWTKTNAVTVRFHSDGDNQLDGFRLLAQENLDQLERTEKGDEFLLSWRYPRKTVAPTTLEDNAVYRWTIRSNNGSIRMDVGSLKLADQDRVVVSWGNSQIEVKDDSYVIISEELKMFVEMRTFSSEESFERNVWFGFEAINDYVPDVPVIQTTTPSSGFVDKYDVITVLCCFFVANF